MRQILRLTATAAIGGLAVMGCSGSSSDAAKADVTVKTCKADASGSKPVAEGSIVNKTSKPSAYAIRVRFLDASRNEVSQGAAAVARVDSGTTSTFRLEGTVSAKGPVACEVSNVTRTAVG